MTLNYRSTRDPQAKTLTASQAILQGLSPDGGLYVPTEAPNLDLNLTELPAMSYQDIAFRVLRAFLTDFTDAELHACVEAAYNEAFDDPAIAPVTHHGDDNYLELFHGPTIAFKDLALQMLPHLMTTAAKKNNFQREIVILTATSGDTGKAAMAGFEDVKDTKIIVFYPNNGVSPIQERQMITQTGDNTYVVAINGNFDEAQTNVKEIFNDHAFAEQLGEHGFQFSSANSINIGRLVPQVAYYFSAYGQLVAQGQLTLGETMNVSVPTGNFGDILAGYYAKQLGLPINKLICASNDNNVLTDFFNTGVYNRKRPFKTTTSPSMDILVSSNLERLLFLALGENAAKTSEYMQSLESEGQYEVTADVLAKLQADFWAGSATGDDDKNAIASVYQTSQYAIDPHTAVAKSAADQFRNATDDHQPMLIVSTASPYKFPNAVLAAIQPEAADLDGLEAVEKLHDIIGVELPPAIHALFNAKVRHNKTVAPDEMRTAIREILDIK